MGNIGELCSYGHAYRDTGTGTCIILSLSLVVAPIDLLLLLRGTTK